ncbi:MAG: DUF4388 domain-containing protein [Terrimicrobiaceae bacterium]
MESPVENQSPASDQGPEVEAVPEAPKTWLFVGDFLFYLRLLARQLSSLAREHGLKKKSMVIVPQMDMVWDQLASGQCEVVILDCAESSEEQLAFINEMKIRYPAVRRILVSATLSRKMESELMHAGAHLCFAKPRNLEEAGSMFLLVDALSSSRGFLPSGTFKGLAPARFIQFLCARQDSGSIAMETDEGEGTLVLQNGEIVDATIGDLQGSAAAARILSLDRTNRCSFKHMQTSQYHTIKLNTSQLWLDSGSARDLSVQVVPEARLAPPAKALQETLGSLDSMENFSLEIDLGAHASQEAGTSPIAEIHAPTSETRPAPINPAKNEEVIFEETRGVISSENCPDVSLRADFLAVISQKGNEVASRLGAGSLLSIQSGDSHDPWSVTFGAKRTIFRRKPGTGSPTPVARASANNAQDFKEVLEGLASLLGAAPVSLCGYFDGHVAKAWVLPRPGQLKEETRESGVIFAFSSCLPALVLHRLPHCRLLWEFMNLRVIVQTVNASSLLLVAFKRSAAQYEIASKLESYVRQLEKPEA